MTLVLVVLAIIWAAVLIPPALRARHEARPGDSISAFRRQLAVLRRARPGAPRGAADWREWSPARGPAPRPTVRPGPPVTSLAAHRAASRAPLDGRRPRGAPPRAFVAAGLPSSRRRAALRRRRDILVGLLATSALTLVAGILPTLRAMLMVHLVVDVLLVAYVALLIRQRTLAAEREMKVRFLPGPRVMEPALLRRSVN
ncbi:MAG TPA: hypothetical protein VHG90_05245 [Acidimicrobiales bacterium]|nr:hypothetical protein [Acidimicrobiales bacterium]